MVWEVFRIGDSVAWFTDGEFALGLIQHVPQLAEAGNAVLAELGEHFAYGETVQPELVVAWLAVVDEHSDAVVDELNDPGVEPADGRKPVCGRPGACASSKMATSRSPQRQDGGVAALLG